MKLNLWRVIFAIVFILVPANTESNMEHLKEKAKLIVQSLSVESRSIAVELAALATSSQTVEEFQASAEALLASRGMLDQTRMPLPTPPR